MSCVLALFWISNVGKRNGGGFIRVFETSPGYIGRHDLTSIGYQFAGCEDSVLVFWNSFSATGFLYDIHRHKVLQDFKFDDSYNYTGRSALPYFFTHHPRGRQVNRHTLAYSTQPLAFQDTTRHLDILPLNSTTLVTRTFSRLGDVLVLALWKPDTVIRKPGILEKQLDGFMCTDGMLSYNPTLKRVIYTYYYRNQFVVLDTALRLMYRHHTLDTIHTARIRVSHSRQYVSLASPQAVVNRFAETYGDRLFIVSAIRADNQMQHTFENGLTLDIYGLQDGSYLFSQFIPLLSTDPVMGISICASKLIVLYRDHFLLYQL